MSHTPILITGCQRSGTTLLSLVIDSHPGIYSIDEDKFECWYMNTYINAPWLPAYVAFKLPRYAPDTSFIKSLRNPRVIWCLRDPLDAVWSMTKLQIALDENNCVAWTAHPFCAQTEITNSYWALDDTVRQELEQDMSRLQEISGRKPGERSRQDNIFIGALCWKVKNELPEKYITERIDYHVVKYESLVTTSGETIRQILDFIGVDWNDDVLRHHEMHEGKSIGETSNKRPIDSSSIGQGVKNFSQGDIDIIEKVCRKTAEKWGYM